MSILFAVKHTNGSISVKGHIGVAKCHCCCDGKHNSNDTGSKNNHQSLQRQLLITVCVVLQYVAPLKGLTEPQSAAIVMFSITCASYCTEHSHHLLKCEQASDPRTRNDRCIMTWTDIS